MPVPTQVSDLSTTIASNSPAGSDNVFPDLDNHIRALAGMLASVATNSATNGYSNPYLPNASAAVFNEAGADIDFRAEGDTDANLLFLDASTDRVGVGTSTPDAKLTVNGVGAFGDGAVGTPSISNTGDLNTGIWFPAADTVAVSTGGAEVARFDSSGNLGLGVTPSAWNSDRKAFQIGGTSAFSAITTGGGCSVSDNVFRNASGQDRYIGSTFATAYTQGSGAHNWFTAPSGTAGNTISFTQAMTLDASGNLGVGETSPGFRLDMKGASSTCFAQMQNSTAAYKAIYGVDATGGVEGAVAGALTNHPFIFRTNNTERARITSGGDLLVGTTSGTFPIVVNKSTGGGVAYQHNGTDKAYFFMNGATVSRWETVTGATIEVSSGNSNGVSLANGGTSWGSLSDERKKDIIEPITNAAQKVSSLRAVIGKYKTESDGTRRAFLIAQDVQSVLPEAVIEDADGSLILQYTETIPLLAAAIKEQQALITALTARVAVLEGV